VARRRIEIYAYRQVLMRLRQGDSEREIAHSGCRRPPTTRCGSRAYCGMGKPARASDSAGEWKVGRGGVELIVGGVNVELSAIADLVSLPTIRSQCNSNLPPTLCSGLCQIWGNHLK